MDAEIHKKLREPFDKAVIGKLPRVWCGKCREATKNRRPSCENHQRAKCNVCTNNMTEAHLHLDYVGHAAITDRLLQVDVLWTWEPVAFGEDGLPVLDRSGGLWIRLTVAGVTRLGYGDAEGKTGPSAVKEAIGDALRNAAMRFGVGLDLWHKDGQLVQHDEPAAPAAAPQPRNGAQNGRQAPSADPPASPADKARSALLAACETNGWDRSAVIDEFMKRYDGADLRTEESAPRITAFTKLLPDVFATPAAVNGAGQ